MIFEGDDLSNVRGFVAAGLGVAVVPAPRAGSPEAGPGPVAYLEILDPGAVREIFLTWSAERRLLPATDLFRRHVIRRAAACRLPGVSDLISRYLAHSSYRVRMAPQRPPAGRHDVGRAVAPRGGARAAGPYGPAATRSADPVPRTSLPGSQ